MHHDGTTKPLEHKSVTSLYGKYNVNIYTNNEVSSTYGKARMPAALRVLRWFFQRMGKENSFPEVRHPRQASEGDGAGMQLHERRKRLASRTGVTKLLHERSSGDRGVTGDAELTPVFLDV